MSRLAARASSSKRVRVPREAGTPGSRLLDRLRVRSAVSAPRPSGKLSSRLPCSQRPCVMVMQKGFFTSNGLLAILASYENQYNFWAEKNTFLLPM